MDTTDQPRAVAAVAETPPLDEAPPLPETERTMRADARRNRERILAAARIAFAERGAETQMDDVAAQAGVGVGTVYRHFPTKEALMGELVRQKFALFVSNATKALEAEGDPFDVLAKLMWTNAEYVARDAATRYAMGEGVEVWDAAVSERAELGEITTELIDRARTVGAVRDDLTVGDISMVMCGVSASMTRGFDWRRHLRLILDGLRPQPVRSGSASR